ncbi:MAG: hypothetical protein JNK81_08070 [Anaerolineales bacterium]|nr:hypothetical protein [Anaerolineales bacterium]
MNIGDFQKINWLVPWRFSEPGLEKELAREVSPKHPLYKIEAIAVGRRQDNDDVLFFFPNHNPPLAVVHLTWNPESSSEFPSHHFFDSIDDFIENQMKKDNIR